MTNVLDYLSWRGDLPFEQFPFSDVDSLIFARLTYIPFESVVPESFMAKPIQLAQAARKVLDLIGENGDGRRFRLADDEKLLLQIEDSERFAGVEVIGFVNRLDVEQEKQFSAVTFCLPDGSIVVAFRGTDGTTVGWKEDLNMSFSDTVPAQRDAVAYLEEAALTFSGPMRVCGHSKGGNLAVYASAFCSRQAQDRIVAVRNNDGPGFNHTVVERDGFQRIVGRTKTFLPQSSVFGMLLEHEEDFSVVHSTNSGIAQHNIFSWEITRRGFVYMENLTNSSQFVDATVKDWVSSLTPEQREKLIDVAFDLLEESNIHSIDELMRGKKNVALIKNVVRSDEESRRLIFAAMHVLKDSMKKSFPIVKERFFGEKKQPESLAAE